jgi:hypothetical protein
LPEKFSNENPELKEDSLNLLFEDYKNEFEDPLLNRIKSVIEQSWDPSDPTHQEALARLKEFLEALRKYYDSYNGLKAAARKERMLYRDVEKYQESIQRADRREKILHDNFITTTNILSRAMKKAGMDNSWRGDDSIYHQGGENDSNDIPARDKFREWMFRIYHEVFRS